MKKLREKCKNKKGFTMVELIVVIVIILVLAAVLVPSLLKYIDKANQANVKADAATLLSQVQADYAAKQASDDTGVTGITNINGVTITETKTTTDIVTTTTLTKDTAKYLVETTGTGTTAYDEITAFAYANNKYTAVWIQGSGWHINKN